MNDQQERVYDWAVKVTSSPEKYSEDEIISAEYILTTMPKKTMADVVWNDHKHYLSGATHKDKEVDRIMLDDYDGLIFNAGLEGNYLLQSSPGELIPNGKKYKYVEVTEHPEVLETEEDFENAPEGTVIAPMHEFVREKREGVWVSKKVDWRGKQGYQKFRVTRWGPEK